MKKIILSLCGGSGSWEKPYVENGYHVINVTLPENDVRNCKPPKNVYGILAAPPCESFSCALRDNGKWSKKNHSMKLETGLEIVNSCIKIIKECNPAFWALENPATGELKKYLGKPKMTFQPWEFGDGWSKKTAIWGNFNIPKKTHTKETCGKLKLYIRPGRNYPSLAFQHKSAAENIPQFSPFFDYIKTDYDLRSITPPGFVRAFFEVNQ